MKAEEHGAHTRKGYDSTGAEMARNDGPELCLGLAEV